MGAKCTKPKTRATKLREEEERARQIADEEERRKNEIKRREEEMAKVKADAAALQARLEAEKKRAEENLRIEREQKLKQEKETEALLKAQEEKVAEAAKLKSLVDEKEKQLKLISPAAQARKLKEAREQGKQEALKQLKNEDRDSDLKRQLEELEKNRKAEANKLAIAERELVSLREKNSKLQKNLAKQQNSPKKKAEFKDQTEAHCPQTLEETAEWIKKTNANFQTCCRPLRDPQRVQASLTPAPAFAPNTKIAQSCCCAVQDHARHRCPVCRRIDLSDAPILM